MTLLTKTTKFESVAFHISEKEQILNSKFNYFKQKIFEI